MPKLALTLLAISILPAAAQTTSQTTPLNALLEETTIHSGTGGQFESAQKDYCAAVVKGGAPACLIFSTSTFGQSDHYLTLLPFASFIHYDQGKYTEKGLTPAEAKALSARRVPPIAQNHESAIALHPDLSILPTVSNAELPINHFTEYRLRPGTSSAFLKAVHDLMLPAARKSNFIAFEVFTTTVGESPDRVFIVTRLHKFVELDQPDPIEAKLSPQERILLRKAIADTVEHRDTYIMRYRADLSTDPRTHQ
ncbi:MAG: hypothetical protein JWQ42_498 [Edaphobacter sp.]|nr:hypothetical protein [Edaphobacter sp.]